MITKLLLAGICLSGPYLKVRVDGEGYLRFIRDGRAVYAKQTELHVEDGKLTDSAGDSLLPNVPVSSAAAKIEIDLQGNVFATYGGQKSKAGQLVLAQFSKTVALIPQDVVLVADDRPRLGNPGDDDFGVVRIVDGLDKTAVLSASAERQRPASETVIPKSITEKIQTSAHMPTSAHAEGGAQGPVQITLQEHSVEEGDHILLGDIAQIDAGPALAKELEKVDLGDTPPTGIKRIIDRARVLAKIRNSGFKPEEMTIVVPGVAEVRRKGQTIPNTQFVEVATQSLMEKGGPAGTWQSTDNFQDLEVPSGKLELKTESISGLDTDNASVIVGIYIEGNRFNSRTVHLHLKEAVPPVQVGSAVKVRIRAGRAVVEISGIARTSGRLGQTIQVEVQVGNPPVKTMHTGVVIDAGTVEVKL